VLIATATPIAYVYRVYCIKRRVFFLVLNKEYRESRNFDVEAEKMTKTLQEQHNMKMEALKRELEAKRKSLRDECEERVRRRAVDVKFRLSDVTLQRCV
jgi:hypothetical protein